MKERKRLVVLFGAGAAISWQAPKTKELTDLVRDSAPSFVCNDGKTKITEFIYSKLKEVGYQDDSQINFETIINAIEELIVHFAYFDGHTRVPSINRTLFNFRFNHIIENFSIAGGIEKHGFKLEIPRGKEYPFSKIALNNQSPRGFYFQHLLAEILTNINAQVSKYSYHSPGKSVINNKTELNQLFINWYRSLSSDALVRMYTLNYDRLFKILIEQSGTPVFEGFDCGEFVQPDYLLPNLERILLDFDSPNYYNLHGSAFWQINSRNNRQLNEISVCLRPYPILESNNDESSVVQIDKGKNILVSNIITGYQKTQKSFIPPFRQMQSAFDKDCILANEVTIVGYSFGDYHINSSVVTALRHNDKLKLHFIDPAYSERDGTGGNEKLQKILIHTLPGIIPNFNQQEMPPVYSEDGNTCTYGKLTVTSSSFADFISRYKIQEAH